MSTVRKVIVVGDDFSPMSEDAILEGLQLVHAGIATELHVVHAHDVGEEVSIADLATLERELLAGTPDSMKRRVRYLAEASSLVCGPTQVVTHARVGRPVQVLLEIAADLDADLMLVGTQGRSGVARWLLGSVAETLVRKARCPVLVARPKAHHGVERSQVPASYYAEPRRSSAESAFQVDARGAANEE